MRIDFAMSDFVGEDNELRETWKPKESEAGLEQLRKDQRLLDQLENAIVTKLTPECQTEPKTKLADARAFLATVDSVTAVDDMSKPLSELPVAYNRAYNDPRCRQQPDEAAGVGGMLAEYVEGSKVEALDQATLEELAGTTPEQVDAAFDRLRKLLPPTIELKGGLLRAETALGWAGGRPRRRVRARPRRDDRLRGRLRVEARVRRLP
jgi:hypothetical protein